MNNVVLMGRLTSDPELQNGNNDNSNYTRLTLAVDRRFRSQNSQEQSADFINCTAFGKTAEFISQYFRKGSRILISGRLQSNNYTNRNGEKVYSMSVIIENAEFCDSKGSNGSGNTNTGNSRSGNTRSSAKNTKQNSNDDFMDVPQGVDDDGLPFN